MTPATIIREALADGVTMTLSPAGTIKATGDGAAVNRWLAVIREHKAAIIDVLKVGAGATASASRWWLLHFADRDPVEVSCTPPVSHAEILERHPDAVAAEPFTPTIRQASTPMTADEEAAILAWLALIRETDQATIAEVIGQCQRDADARGYYLWRAAEEQTQRSGMSRLAACRASTTATRAGNIGSSFHEVRHACESHFATPTNPNNGT